MKPFHEFVACSACHRDYLVADPSRRPPEPTDPALARSTAPLPFYLTTCHHTVCHSCLFASNPAPHPLDQIRLACPACQAITPLAPLDLDDPTNDLAPFFRDPARLAETATMATQFQLSHLMDQISYLKPKCVQQKKNITRLLAEVKKGKEYKA